MKKMMSLFTAVLLFCCMLLPMSASAATTVTLRNGIEFGDTMAEVRAKETLAISSSDSTKLETVAGTIYVGSTAIHNVSIVYHFDSYGKLCDIVWMLPTGNSYAMMDTFGAIYEYHKAIYGSPNSRNYSVRGKAYNGAVDLVDIYKMCGMYGAIAAYDEWVLGDTKIEMVMVEMGTSRYKTEYVGFIGFKYVGR